LIATETAICWPSSSDVITEFTGVASSPFIDVLRSYNPPNHTRGIIQTNKIEGTESAGWMAVIEAAHAAVASKYNSYSYL
jgi:hypothetical protein